MLTEEQIQSQIDVLNYGYGANSANTGGVSDQSNDSGFRFHLDDITYTDNADWYSNCKASSYTFRPALVRDSAKFVNVFTCSGDGYLGWTWMPWTQGEGLSHSDVHDARVPCYHVNRTYLSHWC